MRQTLFLSVVVFVMFFSCSPTKKQETTKPNIIYILADDLGYSELGCYGQEKIETPNIDRLAKEGMRFTQHYSGSAVCAPSRCTLLTGKHTGHSDIRNNNTWPSRGAVQDMFAMLADSTLEGHRPMLEETETIATLLQRAGYKTGMAGKWGLGAPHTNSIPTKKGFDYFIGYICQRIAHTYYPPFIYENDKRLYLDNEAMALSARFPKDADPLDPKNYKAYAQNDYAEDVMYEGIERFIVENKDEPFFFYWASLIPHVALQVPQRWTDHYVEKFGDEEPYLGDKGYYPHRYPKAAYAGMVSYFDENVGKLVAKLKELGVYENTLIIFSSDNGPTFNGGANSQWFESAGILGSQNREIKGSFQEGGIRVPMIASWPNKITAGSTSDLVSAFWDIMPTLCEISGESIPEYTDGISMLPTLIGKGGQRNHDHLYWELGRRQAVRIGKWKGVRSNSKTELGEIKLYDLEVDIAERNNIAEKYPEIVKQIEQVMEDEHETAAIADFKQMVLGDS